MTPISALDWLLNDVSRWVTTPISVVIWVVTTGLTARAFEDNGHTDPEGWFVALFGGFLAGLMWPWFLCFGVPVALGLGSIWALAMLVAHPPRRRRRKLPLERHWTDALPPDTSFERIVELAEERASERQRPNPSVREWR